MWARFTTLIKPSLTRAASALTAFIRQPLRVRRPLVWCAFGAGVGTALGMSWPIAWWIPCAAAAVLLALALVSRGSGSAAGILLMAVAVLLCTGRSAFVWRDTIPPEGVYTVRGIVQDAPHVRQNGRHIAVHLRDVWLTDGDGHAQPLDGLYWTAYVGDDYVLPEPGSVITAAGQLYTPSGQRNPEGFDFRLYLRQNHMSAGFYNSGDYSAAEEQPRSLRAWSIRLRYQLLARLDRVFGESSALPKALLLGEREALSEEDRQAFARVGIAHVLAVSGLHISLLVGALGLLLRPVLDGKKQLWLFGAFLLLYMLLLDFRASVVRASILTFAYLYVRTRGRGGDPLSALSLAFTAILLVSPTDLTNAGFQLSFAAAGGMTLLRRPIYTVTRRFLGRRAGGMTASTLSAVAGTLLPSVQTFHCFSLAGLILSPVACALLACLLPLCLALLAFSFVWLEGASAVAMPLGWIMQRMLDGVSMAASWPYMSLNCPSIPWAFFPLIAAALFLFSGYAPQRIRARRTAILAVLLVLGSAVHLLTLDNGVSYLQLDVGSEDCAVIQDARHTTVVDCGSDGRDLCAYLLAKGRRVNRLVLTHLHADHCYGAQTLMDNGIPIDELVLPIGADEADVSPEALALLERLKQYAGKTTVVSAGDRWSTGRTAAEVLWPLPGAVRRGQDANDFCLCCRYTLDGVSVLMAADLSGQYEPYLDTKADILKVAHHGSRYSSTGDFLRRVGPQTAIISVSSNAAAARPDSDVPNRLRAIGAEVCTTEDCGAIRIDVKSGKGRISRFIEGATP